MALINCPQCEKRFSAFAKACPGCHYPRSKIRKCFQCGASMRRDMDACPKCGAARKGARKKAPAPPASPEVAEETHSEPGEKSETVASEESRAEQYPPSALSDDVRERIEAEERARADTRAKERKTEEEEAYRAEVRRRLQGKASGRPEATAQQPSGKKRLTRKKKVAIGCLGILILYIVALILTDLEVATVTINTKPVEFQSVRHRYTPLTDRSSITLTDSDPPGWSITFFWDGDRNPGEISTDQGLRVEVESPKGGFQVAPGGMEAYIFLTINRFATKAGGHTSGYFAGLFESDVLTHLQAETALTLKDGDFSAARE